MEGKRDIYPMLAKKAHDAMKQAYSPYSRFRVGAALLAGSGKVYTGANVENASFGATCCAERVAVFKAVSEGEREFTALAVACDSQDIAMPCGLCRQVLAEFCRDDMEIVCCDRDLSYQVFTLGQLYPNAFKEF